MQTVTSVGVMRQSDASTIEAGISGLELMYRAGKAIFESFSWQGKTAIVCGAGNNAGDGYVLATLLQKAGVDCSVILLSERFSEEGRYYFNQCKSMGVEICFYREFIDFAEYTEIVDCIFGTGFSGEVDGIYADVIQKINRSGKKVISVDINSGLCGNNGQGKIVVNSDLTLSIGFYQYGHFLGKAKDVMIEKRNLDIGIGLCGDAARLVEASDFGEVLKKRMQFSHKGDYGYVALLGGCREYAGAVKLANLSCAALRAGCGVATLIVPDSIANSVAPYLLESTLAVLPDEQGHLLPDFVALDRILVRQNALAIGMGWGKNAYHADILKHILKNYSIPLVIDADGLNTLAEMDELFLQSSQCNILLTPHLKEFSRLSGHTVEEILVSPIELAREYAARNHVTLLLKGPCTVITDGEEVLLCDRGSAGMATAGSGDVLSGILVGLLGFAPLTPLTAACGAYIAGLAGEMAEHEINEISMLASDTVRNVGKAITSILNA